jgi:hypothetical protein
MADKNSWGASVAGLKSGVFWDAITAGVTVSAVFPILMADNVAIELAWTGTPTATVALAMSNSYRLSEDGVTVKNAGNWTDISTAPSTYPICKVWGAVPAGGASSMMIVAWQVPAAFVRITYTYVSGSGTLTGYSHIKGV